MYLFPHERFGQRFGIDTSVTDFRDAVKECSRAATQDLASRLRFGDFGLYSDRREYFQIRRMFDEGTGLNCTLRLSRGFVLASNLGVKKSSNPVYLRNADDSLIINLRDVNGDGVSDYTFVDFDAGLIQLFGMELTGSWVEVSYEGGLALDDNEEKVFQGVPDWLYEAAMAQAAIYLSRNKTFAVEGGDNLTELKEVVSRTFEQYARFNPSAVQPFSTTTG